MKTSSKISSRALASLSIALILSLLGSQELLAQAPTNASAQMFLTQTKNATEYDFTRNMDQLTRDYDLIVKNGVHYVGVLSLVNADEIDEAQLKALGVLNDTRLEDLWTFRVPVNKFSQFIYAQGLKYVEIGEPVAEFLDASIPSARVDSVHAGLGDLARAYTGKNVVIAVIDWGFDYTHPNFYDTTLTQLRLVRAWDQNKTIGTPPAGYSLGSEYIGMPSLLAAGRDTNYVFGYSSHGSHVAGIAGGSGGGTVYTGAAPEADLMFISLKRDAASLIDAFSYITNYAASVGKPYVVNMSFGRHLGPHDGSDLKNYAMDILNGPGKIFVGSAGNNGTSTSAFHLDRDFSQATGDTLKTVVGFDNQPDQFGQTLSMWGSAYSDFSASILLASATNQVVYATPFYSTVNQPNFSDTILIGTSDTLIVRIMSTAQDFLSNKPNIRLEVRNTSNHKVVLRATSSTTHLHIWNNVRMNNRYTNWGVSLTSAYPGAVGGNNNYGLGEPGGVGKNVITVGSYRAETFTNFGLQLYGTISNFSSKGPTVDGRVKPDISSTGQSVRSSVNSFDITQTAFAKTVVFQGKTYGWNAFSGTSMSGPMVAGIVALMLEANPILSATQAKAILKITARLDQNTGAIGPNGHLQWGWGKANAYAAVKASELLASVGDIQMKENLFAMYPNPATNHVVIDLERQDAIHAIEFFQIDGKASKSINSIFYGKADIDVSDLPKGLYLVRIQTANQFAMEKLLIQ